MRYGPREISKTIPEATVKQALEKYMRELNILYDNEEVKVNFPQGLPVMLIIQKENELQEEVYVIDHNEEEVKELR